MQSKFLCDRELVDVANRTPGVWLPCEIFLVDGKYSFQSRSFSSNETLVVTHNEALHEHVRIALTHSLPWFFGRRLTYVSLIGPTVF